MQAARLVEDALEDRQAAEVGLFGGRAVHYGSVPSAERGWRWW